MSEAPAVLTGTRRERADLRVVPPAVERDEVAADGRVGAVAYPYRIFDVAVRIERPLVGDRTDRFVASVDRSRRLAVRADAFPETVERAVGDALVLPSELSDEGTRERARDAAFKWTLRRYSLNDAPEIRFERDVACHKLFWLVEREDGDVIVDSVRGTEEPLRD